jgi:tRNA (adenine37-N6)-methyltransferase
MRKKVKVSDSILYHPIGIVHSPFKDPKGTPIQPIGGQDIPATVEIFDEYAEGLKDIEGFSHLILIFHMHLIKDFQLKAIPFLDTTEHGIFATRAPARPNPIGFSVVRLEKAEGCVLHIRDVDILDETPLLDIKPFVPMFDAREAEKTGWFTDKGNKIFDKKDDGRFCQ